MKQAHKFRMDGLAGEFDEVFVKNASVHIERMSDTAFWIGIDAPGLPFLIVNTGIDGGQWYFNVEEDTCGGRSFSVRRARKPERKPSR